MHIHTTHGFFDQLFFDSRSKDYETETSINLNVDILTRSEQFHRLSDEWNTLLQGSSANNIFLTWEWVSTWWKYFHDSSSLWIVTVRHPQSKQLLGLAPLVIKRQRNFAGILGHQLIFLGNGAAAPDHLDFIILRGHEHQIVPIFSAMLWEQRHLWDEINIDGIVSQTSVLYDLIQQHPHLMKQIERTVCPYLSLPKDWQTLKHSLGKNMRYNLGRFQRRLQKDYPGVTKINQYHDSENVMDFMPLLYNLHAIAQNRKNNPGIFADQNMMDFHTELATVFSQNNWLRAYTLDVGQTSIAALYCFQYCNTVYFYQSGFDLFWRRYSPGSQLMAHAIKAAIEEKVQIFDFLRGEEEYKFEWTSTYNTNLKFTIPVSFHRQMNLLLKRSRFHLKNHLLTED